MDSNDHWTQFVRFLTAREGPTTVEYAALILVAVLGCLTAVTVYSQASAGTVGPPQSVIQERL